MGRSAWSVALQLAREAERAQKAQLRQQERHLKAQLRARKEAEKCDRKAYLEARASECDDLNKALEKAISDLGDVLPAVLRKSPALDWGALEHRVDLRDVERSYQELVGKRPMPADFSVKRPGLFARMRPGWRQRYERAMMDAMTAFELAESRHSSAVQAQQAAVAALFDNANQLNDRISEFRAAYSAHNPEAIGAYYDLIFEQSSYPDGFPHQWKSVFLPASRQLIVDFDLPTLDSSIPSAERHRYTKSIDEITETKKPQKVRQSLYSSLVAQLVLRRLYEIFASDTASAIDVAAVNAFVDAIDPSTGQRVRPCLISVRTTRDEFTKLDLRHVDPAACLKRLNAAVSRSPSELAAVKPIIDINMTDPRFIQETDVLGMLDARPNLMELTPGEFENLITNLFQKMGLETKLTQASRDGGVDCVAFDPRPVLGGKIVIQAKRYKHTVGVSAVRDLYGTVHNEGASKGILVTTSGYGKAAFDFQSGKPLELYDGSNLLYMLKEYAGIDAKILMPED